MGLNAVSVVVVIAGTMVCHEGTQKDLFLRAAMLHKRWGMAPRSLVTGPGFKPPRAAVVKNHGGERRWKRH